MNRLKPYLPFTLLLLLLGSAALLAGLLPGGLSPSGLLKFIADRLVSDGDFESVDAAFYNRLRPLFLGLGMWLLASWFLLRRGRQTGERGWLRWTAVLGGAMGLLLGILILNLAVLRLDSPIYRYLVQTEVPLAAATASPTPAPTATEQPPPTPVPLELGHWELVASEIQQPVVFANAGDGSGRLFVGIRRGRIWVIQNGVVLETPFLDLRDRALQQFNSLEQGLLGLAFHPQFAENGYFYVNYIDLNQNTVVSRFQVSAEDPNRADPDSEVRLFGILQPTEMHNAGHLVFGPDGYLYISSGDGGPQGDPFGAGQSLDTMLGKILRIDVDGAPPYSIPADNPFVGTAGLDEIFTFGLRNPWRFSFDALTGDLYIGDVGHNHFEEVNFIPAGSPEKVNLGWSHFEGFDIYPLDAQPPLEPITGYTPPVWVYEHGGGGLCAIVGGYVYRGSAIPALEGMYIYGDYCAGNIWGLHQDSNGEWVNEFLFDTTFTITSFGVDENNEIYVLTLSGEVYHLVP